MGQLTVSVHQGCRVVDVPSVSKTIYLVIYNSWEICHRCAKILLAAEHKMQLAYYLRNTDWFQR